MNFKPGDKVWVYNPGGIYPAGTFAAITVSQSTPYGAGWWEVEIFDIPERPLFAHEENMRRRDDPPPQQEPKREAVGDWDLCPWRPVSVPKEVA